MDGMDLFGGQSQEDQIWQGHMPPPLPHTAYVGDEFPYSTDFIQAGPFWPDELDSPFTECGPESISPVRHDLATSAALPDVSDSSNALYRLDPIDPTLSFQSLTVASMTSNEGAAPSRTAVEAARTGSLSCP